ncbi:MAG TPA: hypothetical protein VF681_03555 [Abditibacteriaceae bacterium]|jgi:hypothetical protein
MVAKSHRRFSRAKIAFFAIPLLLPVAAKTGVAFEKGHNHYPIWDNVMGKLIPSRNKPCCGGMRQIGLKAVQIPKANRKASKRN